jgi:hypothetical protein
MTFPYILLWMIPSIAIYLTLVTQVGMGAVRRGRDGGLWSIYALLASPLVAALSLFLLGEAPEKKAAKAVPDNWKRGK